MVSGPLPAFIAAYGCVPLIGCGQMGQEGRFVRQATVSVRACSHALIKVYGLMAGRANCKVGQKLMAIAHVKRRRWPLLVSRGNCSEVALIFNKVAVGPCPLPAPSPRYNSGHGRHKQPATNRSSCRTLSAVPAEVPPLWTAVDFFINFIRPTLEVDGQRAPDSWSDYRCLDCGTTARWHRKRWE